MKRFLSFSLVILPVCLFAEGGLPDKPYIYVEGKAEVKKPADLVTMRFDLVGRAPEQPKANEDVQSKSKQILSMLKDRKIAESDVIAEDLRSEPEYEQDENSSRAHGKLIGYKVTRPFQIRVRDLMSFPKLADELIKIQGVEFSGVDGGLAKEKEIEPEVWQKALANAREQAEKTLKPIGMKIDSVFAVSPVSFPSIQSRIFGSGSEAMYEARAPAGGSAEPEYRLAPITISQSVHVIYLISPAK
ncbi:MAG TPA: SIMPL domain-containing protein [Chthoniobacterales bacterium]|jgi:uncharacterized protein YggE|nr:SIMPL domain-containing protein [Chthoniobacterales bacterium]